MRRSAKEYGKCEDILQGIKVIFKYPSIPGSKKSKAAAAAAGEEDDTIAMFQYKEEWKLVKKEEHDHIDHCRRFTALLIGSMSANMRNECLLKADFAAAVNSNKVEVIWNTIRDVCIHKKIANVGQLRRDFYRIRQGSLSFPDFIAEFDRRLAELVLYEVTISEEDLIMILSSAVDESFFADFLKDEYIREKRISRENNGEGEKKKYLEWKQELMFFYESQILYCRPAVKKIPQVAAVANKVNKNDKSKNPPAVKPKGRRNHQMKTKEQESIYHPIILSL
jgi:hypothetical protein